LLGLDKTLILYLDQDEPAQTFDKSLFLLYIPDIQEKKLSAFSADFLNYGSKKHRYYRSRRPRQNRFNRCFDEADGNG